MENIQRDLEKKLAAASLQKTSRKPKRWTLMFVGDHGKVFSIKRFKCLAFLWISSLLVSIFIAAGLYYLYQNMHQANTKLGVSLENSQQVLISLRNEKDILMARLVVAESRLAALQAEAKKRPAEAVSDNLVAGPSPAEKKQGVTAVKESPPPPPEAQEERRADTEKVAISTVETSVSINVAIEDFKVYYEPDTRTYRAQFKLKNVDSNSIPISGYTAVVLKNDALSQDKWMTLPTVKLVDGKPFGYKRGQYFSISRFKTVKFITTNPSNPKRFNTATVFVFDAQKRLLLEKKIPVRIDNISPPANG
jgi:hypothetical protein